MWSPLKAPPYCTFSWIAIRVILEEEVIGKLQSFADELRPMLEELELKADRANSRRGAPAKPTADKGSL